MVLFIITASGICVVVCPLPEYRLSLWRFVCVNGLNKRTATFCLITAILLIFRHLPGRIACTAVLMVPVMWPIAQELRDWCIRALCYDCFSISNVIDWYLCDTYCIVASILYSRASIPVSNWKWRSDCRERKKTERCRSLSYVAVFTFLSRTVVVPQICTFYWLI